MNHLELEKLANEIRKSIVTAVHSAKSGHPGGSLSAADIYSYLFFEELNIPKPDANLEVKSGSQAVQTAAIMVAFEKELMENPTDLVLVVGDVTSTMACSIVAKKLNTKVAHVEAGIRSFDLTMPEEINRILTDTEKVIGVKTKSGKVFKADAVIVAAGGASYPGTGSDGSGFKLAEKLGHAIIPLKPSLVPLTSDSPYIPDLQGLSLRNVQATVYSSGSKAASEFGEMLFTHFGVSGPIILSLSKTVAAL